MTNVERLDFTQHPPGYEIGLGVTSGADAWEWHANDGDPHACGEEDDEAATLAAAWASYKASNDPPGMSVAWEPDDPTDEHSDGEWLITTSILGPTLVCQWLTKRYDDKDASEAEARANAWVWYERRLALDTQLQDDVIACPDCYSRDAYVEAIDDTTSTQPWCTECDLEMGGIFDAESHWPRCLTWADDQCADIENWLADETLEMPEVIRG